jgi:hypothetical protein
MLYDNFRLSYFSILTNIYFYLIEVLPGGSVVAQIAMHELRASQARLRILARQ